MGLSNEAEDEAAKEELIFEKMTSELVTQLRYFAQGNSSQWQPLTKITNLN